MRLRLLSVLMLSVALAALAPAAVPPAEHVAIVVLENTNYSSVIGSSNMPWLNNLANNNALATKYYANTHPSIGNYFMMTTGKIITNDDGFNSTVTADNVVRRMLTAGKTWKSYAESLPYAGYTGWDKYPYTKHHNPFAYLSDVVNSSGEKMRLVPFTQLATDIQNNTLPNYLFIIPNQQNNMHNCPKGMSTCTLADKAKNADNWLKTNIAPLLANAEFQKNGILVITWDEASSGDSSYGGGRIVTIVAGATAKKGYKSTTFYQHQSLLRTSMALLGMTTFPGAAATAPDMGEMFGSSSTQPISGCTLSTASPSVTICTPSAGSTVGSPVHVVAGATSSPSATKMFVWVDGVKKYETAGSKVDVSLAIGSGDHRVTVQAYNGTTYFKSTVYITVK